MNKIMVWLVVLGLICGLAAPVWARELPAGTSTPTSFATLTSAPRATLPPTFTPQPTYTLLPTYTPLPSQTPLPPQPLPTPLPPLPPIDRGRDGDGKKGQVVFGDSYILPAGERLVGDLVVFGGTATLEPDSRVEGNLVVVGGSADIYGRVDGNLVMVGGAAHLRDSAVIRGDLVRVGGAVEQDEGATIHGEETSAPPVIAPPIRPRVWSWQFDPFEMIGNIFETFTWTIVLAALAMLLAALWPVPITRAMRALAEAAPLSWAVGALSFVIAVLTSLALIIALCIGLLGFVVILALCLYSWFIVGTLIGQRLLDALNIRGTTLVAAAGVGTALITLLTGIPCVKVLVLFVLAPAGIGAVILTRFGTQPYVPGPPAPPVRPQPPVSPPPLGIPDAPSVPVASVPAIPAPPPPTTYEPVITLEPELPPPAEAAPPDATTGST